MRRLALLSALACGASGCTTTNDCGAKALASVMGPTADIGILYEQTYTSGRGGALTVDMLGAARRHGYEPQLVLSWDALRSRLTEGYKVIVLQNRRVEWWPQWHYAVVTGFDAQREMLTIEDEPDVKRVTFMNMWRDGHHWGVILMAPKSRRPTQTHLTTTVRAAPGGTSTNSVKSSSVGNRFMGK